MNQSKYNRKRSLVQLLRTAMALGLGTLVLASVSGLIGAIIGTNPPALPLSAERIGHLPAPQQRAWKDYLARSQRQLRADPATFTQELKKHHLEQSSVPPQGRGVRGLRL